MGVKLKSRSRIKSRVNNLKPTSVRERVGASEIKKRSQKIVYNVGFRSLGFCNLCLYHQGFLFHIYYIFGPASDTLGMVLVPVS